MRSERGARFGSLLLKHISAAHPQQATEIVRSTDPFAAYCSFRLFTGDQNFKELLDEQQAELLNWIDPPDEEEETTIDRERQLDETAEPEPDPVLPPPGA